MVIITSIVDLSVEGEKENALPPCPSSSLHIIEALHRVKIHHPRLKRLSVIMRIKCGIPRGTQYQEEECFSVINYAIILHFAFEFYIVFC